MAKDVLLILTYHWQRSCEYMNHWDSDPNPVVVWAHLDHCSCPFLSYSFSQNYSRNADKLSSVVQYMSEELAEWPVECQRGSESSTILQFCMHLVLHKTLSQGPSGGTGVKVLSAFSNHLPTHSI